MTLLNEVETLRAMRNSFQPRTLAIFGSLGFVVQQLVSMGLCALGLVQTHYDVELGPHTTGWPLPPDRLDRAWIGWVGPALFPMPDSGTGDNGDRGASTGLQEDDRAQQLPFVVEHREQAFIAWRAPRGNLFGRTLGEQWAVVGPIDESYVDAFREVTEAPDQYTWWSNRGQAWAKNVGWRIDYQIVSRGLVGAARSVSIHKSSRFSDHAPLTIDYAL